MHYVTAFDRVFYFEAVLCVIVFCVRGEEIYIALRRTHLLSFVARPWPLITVWHNLFGSTNAVKRGVAAFSRALHHDVSGTTFVGGSQY